MIEASDISYSVRNKKILSGISFRAEPGRICAVIGPNGAGKSTLLKILAGVLRQRSGQVSVSGQDISSMSSSLRAKNIAYLPQTSGAVPCSVRDAVLLGRKPHMSFYPSVNDHKITDSIMDQFRLSEMKDECVTKISGGELQKTHIARAVAQGSPILLMDEPVNHLDIKNRMEIMELTAGITYENKLTSIIVLHDLNLAVRYADDILVMKEGRLRAFTQAQSLDEPLLSEVYDMPVKIGTMNGIPCLMY
ncbi:MAG: ABC transporter ATP-binding protein [Deferribacterales bacterium]